MEQLKKGDVVQLKSGGPMMTVIEIDDAGRLYCQWFNSRGKVQAQGFAVDSVMLCEKRGNYFVPKHID